MKELPTSETFKLEIEKILNTARSNGEEFTDITSGDLHRTVGGYPSKNHRMATCCEVMYSIMKSNDAVISGPLKGKGATLIVRYFNV